MVTGLNRFFYRNLKNEAEVEMTRVENPHSYPAALDSGLQNLNGVPKSSSATSGKLTRKRNLISLMLSCAVASGVQFGWALQLSLLTPYIQTLGIDHTFSSFIWLCGPITGLVVQPCVGNWSDKCTSKFGRRRPFILAGSLMISIAVIIIGFSADIGYVFGDTEEHCSTFKGTRKVAAFIFVFGFWMLDLANNTVQGPARALLADLLGPDQINLANALFCSWMAIGNVLGFSAGATGSWHRLFPFLTSRACCEACANLKAAFLVAIVFLTLCTLATLFFAEEVPLTMVQSRHSSDSAPLLDNLQKTVLEIPKSRPDILDVSCSPNGNEVSNGFAKNMTFSSAMSIEDKEDSYGDGPGAVFINLLITLRNLPPGMLTVLIVMALTWLSWFPFFLFDTDWMGREIYHGDPKGTSDEVEFYDKGVREGAYGLLLNSVVLGISSFFVEPLCQKLGARLVWAISNFIVFASMAGTAALSFISVREYSKGIQHVIEGDDSIKIAALIVFALLGVPLSIVYSIPYSVTMELTAESDCGQGLAIGVLNLAIVVPQMIVSVGAGQWDALFGGGNMPAFVLASMCAVAAGITAVLRLPVISKSSFNSLGFHFG